MKAIMASIGEKLNRKSITAVAMLENRMPQVMLGWLTFIAIGGVLRTIFAASPIDGGLRLIETLMPYVLIGGAPVVAFVISDRVFPRGVLLQQPDIRLARYGKWQNLNVLAARQHPSFGPTGMMASLLIGMLLNVPVRSLEFLAAVPAMNANAPLWGQVLLATMTADVVIMNFLYVATFVAALRCVPWFPRLLVLVWSIDILSQLTMAQLVGHAPGLPSTVGSALSTLLDGNIKKVLISATLWLPYLILSDRVNLTYRSRVSVK